jgi:hypothetical protein
MAENGGTQNSTVAGSDGSVDASGQSSTRTPSGMSPSSS